MKRAGDAGINRKKAVTAPATAALKICILLQVCVWGGRTGQGCLMSRLVESGEWKGQRGRIKEDSRNSGLKAVQVGEGAVD